MDMETFGIIVKCIVAVILLIIAIICMVHFIVFLIIDIRTGIRNERRKSSYYRKDQLENGNKRY